MAAKIVAFFTLIIFLFVGFLNPVIAQQPQVITNEQSNDYTSLPYKVESQSPIHSNLMFFNALHTISCISSGASLIEKCVDYTFVKDFRGTVSAVPVLSSVDTSGGIVGTGISLITSLFVNKPIYTSDYLASMGQDFGIVKEANAQVAGSGNNVLNPIFALWEASRNIAYLAMILIFLIIGLMVMFRQKINPQTVVTIQAALPGLVIGLILITFSYFFAALLTDVAFVGTDLVGFYFNSVTGENKPSLLNQLKDKNVISVGTSFAGRLSTNQIADIADQLIKNLESWPKDAASGANPVFNAQNMVRLAVSLISYQLGSTLGQAGGALIDTLAGFSPILRGTSFANQITTVGSRWTSTNGLRETASQVNALGGPLVGSMFAFIGYTQPHVMIGFLLYIVAIFAVIYAVFRLFLALLNNYLAIIFLTITAPFQFLMASLPGRQGVATNWVRNMLCNALVFPAIIAVFYFAAYLLGDNTIATFGLANPLTPIGNNGTLPLFGNMDLSSIRILLAFGAILAAPKIPDIICKAVGKPGGAGGVLDQGINQMFSSGQRYSNELQSNIGKTRGSMKESWTRLKGQDPYGALADKIRYFRKMRIGEDPTAARQLGVKQYEPDHFLWSRSKLHTDYEKQEQVKEASREDKNETAAHAAQQARLDRIRGNRVPVRPSNLPVTPGRAANLGTNVATDIVSPSRQRGKLAYAGQEAYKLRRKEGRGGGGRH